MYIYNRVTGLHGHPVTAISWATNLSLRGDVSVQAQEQPTRQRF